MLTTVQSVTVPLNTQYKYRLRLVTHVWVLVKQMREETLLRNYSQCITYSKWFSTHTFSKASQLI